MTQSYSEHLAQQRAERARRSAALKADSDRAADRLRLAAQHLIAAFRAQERRAFDPNQPRVPAGHPDGGRWADTGARDLAQPSTSNGPLRNLVHLAEVVDPTRANDASPAGAKPYKTDRLPEDALLLTDDTGVPLQNFKAEEEERLIYFPPNFPPEFYIARGERIRSLLQYGDDRGTVGLVVLGLELSKFGQGHEWDAQRIDGLTYTKYINYATVSIGLYSASAGMSLDEILKIQDIYASFNSKFNSKATRDARYTALPERNVENTRIGFELYRTRRYGVRKP